LRRLAFAALVTAAALAGCGDVKSPDLFVVHRVGSIPGARLTLLMSDSGLVTCNGVPHGDVTSHELLLARQIVRDLEGLKGNGDGNDTVGPADRNLHLKARPGSVMSFEVRAEAGTVGFSDNSLRQPKVFYDIQQFTREIAQKRCGLPR